MSKVSWKEIEQTFEDEEPIEEKPMTWEELRAYDEWMNYKREEEEEDWDDDIYDWDYYDWDYDEWYDDDSN